MKKQYSANTTVQTASELAKKPNPKKPARKKPVKKTTKES